MQGQFQGVALPLCHFVRAQGVTAHKFLRASYSSEKNLVLIKCDFQIEEVDLVERRGYLTLRILVKNEAGRLLLRKTDGIRKWFQLLQVKLVETS